MRFRSLYIILTLLLSLLSAEDTIVIGSGLKGKGYFTLAKSIQKINNLNTKIVIKESSGSIENLQRLQNGEIDLAIVQGDAAFYAENGKYSFDNNPVNNLSAIITFYNEPLFLITNKKTINNIHQLTNFRINVGVRNSGTENTAMVLFKSIGLWNSITKYHYDPDKSIRYLLQDKIQAILLNHIDDSLKKKIQNNELSIVPISKDLIKTLHSTFPFFAIYDYDLDDETVSTVSVPTMLIGNKELDSTIIYQLTKLLDTHYGELSFPEGFQKSQNHFQNNSIDSWHEGSLKYIEEKHIKLTGRDYFDLYALYMIVAVIIMIIFVLIVAMYILHHADLFHRYKSSHKAIASLQKIYLIISKYKYTSLLLTISLLYFTSTLLIKYFEHRWALEHGMFSAFDNYSINKSLSWLFVFGNSGYDDNLFPNSEGGRFVVSLAPMLGVSGVVAFIGLLTFDQIKKHFMGVNGMGTQRIKDHIILCGWNDNAHFIIRNLLHKNIIHKKQIVILADMQYEEPIKKFDFDPMYVFYVKGHATIREDLLRANITEADIAIVISDNKHPEADAKNILKVLTIEKFCLELEEAGKRVGRSNIHTIAEIANPQNIPIAEDAGVDQIISLGNIESKIFTQAVQNPGVAKFINEIVTYNDQNDIYSFPIHKESQLFNKTYDEILSILRQYKVLLLSINVENKKTKMETERIMKKYDLENPVITNPFRDSETKYTTHENDLIIVLAQYEKIVLDALKKLGDQHAA